ncbi:hypothetical protein Dimus_014030 [Dionaea muscipula]
MATSHSSSVSSRSIYMNDIDSDNINPDNLNNTIDLDIAVIEGRIGPGVMKETQNSETQASERTEPCNKRMKMQPRSQVWQHFTRSESSDGVKAVCNYYKANFYCDSRKNVKFEKAFERLADSDLGYYSEMTKGDGVIIDIDWVNVRMFVCFLEHFYDLTRQVSGSLYVTSSSTFELISNAYAEILECNEAILLISWIWPLE